MRSLWNYLGDPGLHLLIVALILVYVTLGGSPWDHPAGTEPLPFCKACRFHYLPDKPCPCRAGSGLAHAHGLP